MEDFLTVAQAAARAGVTVSAVYKAVREHRLPSATILDRIAIRPADVDSFPWGTYTVPGKETKVRQKIPRRYPGNKDSKAT